MIQVKVGAMFGFTLVHLRKMALYRRSFPSLSTVCDVKYSAVRSGAPIRAHTFIRLNNISNMLRYVYEKPPHNNRKCGWRHALTCVMRPPLVRIDASVLTTFRIFHAVYMRNHCIITTFRIFYAVYMRNHRIITTFRILYAVYMRNHRIIIGNVVAGPVTCSRGRGVAFSHIPYYYGVAAVRIGLQRQVIGS